MGLISKFNYPKREHKGSIQFKNGNLTLRIPKEELAEFQKDQILYLSDLLWWLDCDFIGETYCLNNWETGHTIYNSYMDCTYIFRWSDLDLLAKGRKVKLWALPIDEADREWMERNRGNGSSM